MKKTTLAVVLSSLSLFCLHGQTDAEEPGVSPDDRPLHVISEEGENIILYPDGTWREAPPLFLGIEGLTWYTRGIDELEGVDVRYSPDSEYYGTIFGYAFQLKHWRLKYPEDGEREYNFLIIPDPSKPISEAYVDVVSTVADFYKALYDYPGLPVQTYMKLKDNGLVEGSFVPSEVIQEGLATGSIAVCTSFAVYDLGIVIQLDEVIGVHFLRGSYRLNYWIDSWSESDEYPFSWRRDLYELYGQ